MHQFVINITKNIDLNRNKYISINFYHRIPFNPYDINIPTATHPKPHSQFAHNHHHRRRRRRDSPITQTHLISCSPRARLLYISIYLHQPTSAFAASRGRLYPSAALVCAKRLSLCHPLHLRREGRKGGREPETATAMMSLARASARALIARAIARRRSQLLPQ